MADGGGSEAEAEQAQYAAARPHPHIRALALALTSPALSTRCLMLSQPRYPELCPGPTLPVYACTMPCPVPAHYLLAHHAMCACYAVVFTGRDARAHVGGGAASDGDGGWCDRSLDSPSWVLLRRTRSILWPRV
eukprot:2858417-Rhodomonas_salina.1